MKRRALFLMYTMMICHAVFAQHTLTYKVPSMPNPEIRKATLERDWVNVQKHRLS